MGQVMDLRKIKIWHPSDTTRAAEGHERYERQPGSACETERSCYVMIKGTARTQRANSCHPM